MSVTWAELSRNRDHEEAFEIIGAFFKSVDRKYFSNAEISQILLAGAFSIIDYDDPSDMVSNFQFDDGRARQVRLSNFMDYVSEYTQRRMAQNPEIDRHLAGTLKQLDDLDTGHEDVPDIVGTEFEDLLLSTDDLSANMLAKGLGRLSVAKAYVGVAFLAALLDSDQYYQEFCAQLLQSMDPESETLHARFAQEQELMDAALKSVAAGGSSTVH